MLFLSKSEKVSKEALPSNSFLSLPSFNISKIQPGMRCGFVDDAFFETFPGALRWDPSVVDIHPFEYSVIFNIKDISSLSEFGVGMELDVGLEPSIVEDLYTEFWVCGLKFDSNTMHYTTTKIKGFVGNAAGQIYRMDLSSLSDTYDYIMLAPVIRNQTNTEQLNTLPKYFRYLFRIIGY